MPTVAISAIMVAAYKKYCLVSLLKFGKEIALPRYASHIVERALKVNILFGVVLLLCIIVCSPYVVPTFK